MQIIALTGGIAAGKSTVSARWAEYGAVIVDADQLAREAVEPGTPGLAAVRDRFGSSVITPAGSLDRPKLGAIVFGDAGSRAELNGIVHPAVWRLAQERFEAAQSSDPDALVVYDVPLLVEASADRPLRIDTVVVVHAPAVQRIERLVTYRGMDRAEAQRRVAAQASDEERLALADAVVDASGSMEATLASADQVWGALGRS